MKVLKFTYESGLEFFDYVSIADPTEEAKAVSRKVHDVMRTEVTTDIAIKTIPEAGLAAALWAHTEGQERTPGIVAMDSATARTLPRAEVVQGSPAEYTHIEDGDPDMASAASQTD